MRRSALLVLAAVAALLVSSGVAIAVTPASASPAFEFLFEEGSGTTAINTGTVGSASNGSIGEGISYSTDTPLGTGYALDFEGIGDDTFPKTKGRVFVPQDHNYSDQVTIEAWVKPDRTDGQRVVWDDFGGPGVLLGIWDGRVQFGGFASGVGDRSNFSGNVEAGKWQHIAGVYDGTALRVCVDGESTGVDEPATGEFVENPIDSGGYIGNGGGENLPWDGKIDDFRIWPVALQCDQVAGGHFATSSAPCTIGEIKPPVNDVSGATEEGMSSYKRGSRGVIPAKFSAACSGDPIDTQAEADDHPMNLKLTKLASGTASDTVIENTVTGSANTGDLFRFVDADDHYIYNIGVNNLATGTYRITISEANGGGSHDEWFAIK